MACTPEEVKEITGSTLADAVIQPFIDVAQCLIDAVSDCAGASQVCEDKACAYLSAHLLTTSNVGKASAAIKSESLEDVYKVAYARNTHAGTGVMSTDFGQTANMLMSGCLAETGKPKVGMFSAGAVSC